MPVKRNKLNDRMKYDGKFSTDRDRKRDRDKWKLNNRPGKVQPYELQKEFM